MHSPQFRPLIIFLVAFFIVLISGAGRDSLCYAEPVAFDVYMNGSLTGETGFVENDTPYLPASMIGQYFDNKNITLDLTAKQITIDLSRASILLADDFTTNFVKSNAGTVYIPLRTIQETAYFPLNVTNQFYKLQYSIMNGSIYLKDFTGTGKIAKVNRDNIEAIPSLTENTLSSIKLNSADTVSIIGQSDHYYKAELMDGTIAYVQKDDVTISEIDLAKVDFYSPRKKKFKQGSEKISLVWDYVSKVTPPAPTGKIDGVDILSPTWFDLIVDGGGRVENNGDRGYTDAAHENGYMVWATVTNNMSTKGSTAFTTSVFNTPALLNKSVAQYIFYSCLYGVDGINIDYEDVADADSAGLTGFTALLRQYTERQGFVLSIDTTVPRPWTQEYNRRQLSNYVDYIAVMTYDEHWSTSPIAGSVASYPWVEDAVLKMLDEVPNEKLLMGVPLYMRAWHFDSSGTLLKSTANTMPTIRAIIEEKGLTPEWLDKERQYFTEYPDAGLTKKIWIEDGRSIANKLEIIQKYDLAGAASWQLSQAEESIWTVFYGMLKKSYPASYYENEY